MASKTLERELLAMEHEYWRAIKERDVEAILSLTRDPCLIAGAQGISSIDKTTFQAMLQDPSWTIDEFKIKDGATVRQIHKDVAVVAYLVREKLTVEGESVVLDAADVSTWVRKNGRWLCALHTESIAGDPFGRDRQSG